MKWFIIIPAVLLLPLSGMQAQESPFDSMKKTMTPLNTKGVQSGKDQLSAYKIDDSSIYVFWETAEKEGTYLLEHSQDGNEFRVVADIQADGSSEFVFVDKEPNAKNVYRLKYVSLFRRVTVCDNIQADLHTPKPNTRSSENSVGQRGNTRLVSN